MKIIFVISPDYLEVIYNQAIGYDFYIQGYGSIEAAMQGLVKTNISDILGFAYVADKLDDDLNPLANFIDRCDMLVVNSKKRRKFIFALQDTTGLMNIFNIRKYEGIKAMYVPQLDVVTDVVINQNIFGSILLDNYKPYILKEDVKKESPNWTHKKLQYSPLFSQVYFDCLQPPDCLDSYEQTLLYDKVYQDFLGFNPILAKIRDVIIRREFNLDSNKEELIELVNDNTSFCIYRALIEIVFNEEVYNEFALLLE